MTFKDASRPVYIRCGAICSHTTYCSLFCVKGEWRGWGVSGE